MRKKKLTFLADLAVLVLCVCAIAIGVYSAKNASLNVGGTVGFNAHDCEVEVYAEITGAVDEQNKAITEDNKAGANPFFRDGESGKSPVKITGAKTWDFGKIYFDDLNVADGKEVNDIIFTFTITNKSAFEVYFDFTRPTQIEGMSITGKVSDTEMYTTILSQDTPITYTLTISLESAESNSVAKISDMVLNFGKVNSKSLDDVKSSIKNSDNGSATVDFTISEVNKTVDIVFGSDTGNDSDGNAIVYSGDIIVPRAMKKDNVTYTTNSVEFKTANYSAVTSVNVDSFEVKNGFGGLSTLSASDSMKSLIINVDKDFNISSNSNGYFNNMSLDTISITSKCNITFDQYNCSINTKHINNFSLNANIINKYSNWIYGAQDNEYSYIETLEYAIDNFSLVAKKLGEKQYSLTPEQQENYGFGYAGIKNVLVENVDDRILLEGVFFMVHFAPAFRCPKVSLLNAGIYTSYIGSEDNDMIYDAEKKILKYAGENFKAIPDDAQSISDYAIINTSIKDLIIPKSLATFYSPNNILFPNVDKIETIMVDSDNPYLDSRDNCNAIINKNTNELIFGCKNTQIPNSVTSIGKNAFAYCKDLTSITIPEGVTTIGDYAFRNCTNLTSITIPETVTTVYQDTFSGCLENLQNVEDDLIYIKTTNNPYYLLYGTSGKDKESVNINSNCKLICGSALSGYTKLTSIVIPDGVTGIGNYAFSGCTGLTSVSLPNSIVKIGDYAFYNCTKPTSLTIPTNVTSIGDSAFRNWSGITSLTIPNSVTNLCDYAFSGCKGLTTISIPNSITVLNNYVFSGCTGLTSVTIPDTVTEIGEGSFSSCSGLTSLTIPTNVTKIGRHSFSSCSGLTSVTFNESLTEIGGGAFDGCTKINKVYITSLEKWFNIKFDDYWGSTTGTSNPLYYGANLYLNGTLITELVIPTGTKIISYCAFYNYKKLISVTIPDSVTSISKYAFYGCTGLKSVTIGKGVTNINDYAFYGCTGLTSITIPNSVKSIRSNAFSKCTNLTTTIGDGWVKWSGGVVPSDTLLKDITDSIERA